MAIEIFNLYYACLLDNWNAVIFSLWATICKKKWIIKYQIPNIDIVIVDLYPFEETVINSKSHQEIIEKIDGDHEAAILRGKELVEDLTEQDS